MEYMVPCYLIRIIITRNKKMHRRVHLVLHLEDLGMCIQMQRILKRHYCMGIHHSMHIDLA